MLPQVAEGSVARLTSLLESSEDGAVKAAASAKLAAAKEKLAKLGAPAEAFDKAHASFTVLLDALDKALDRPAVEGKPAFIAGEEASLADVATSCLLARAHWAAEPREALLARPRVAAYWAHASARPAFERADVWTGLKPGAALALLGEAAVDSVRAVYALTAREWNANVAPPLGHAWHAVADPVAGAAVAAGDAINTHVVRPVTETPAFMATSLAVKMGAHATGDFLKEKVLTPVKAGGEHAGTWFAEAAEATKHAAERAAEATMAAAGEAAEATKHAAQQAADATKQAAERVKEATSPKAETPEEKEKREEAEKKKAEEDAAKKKADEEAKKKAADDAAAKKKADDEAAAKKKADDEAAARKQREEEDKKKADEEAAKKAADEAA